MRGQTGTRGGTPQRQTSWLFLSTGWERKTQTSENWLKGMSLCLGLYTQREILQNLLPLNDYPVTFHLVPPEESTIWTTHHAQGQTTHDPPNPVPDLPWLWSSPGREGGTEQLNYRPKVTGGSRMRHGKYCGSNHGNWEWHPGRTETELDLADRKERDAVPVLKWHLGPTGGTGLGGTGEHAFTWL